MFKKQYEPGLLSVEVVTLIYMIITAVMTLIWWNGITDPAMMMYWRGGVVVYMALAIGLYHLWPCRFMVALRALPLLACLAQWYPETYEFCKQFPYQDHFFAAVDNLLFGCQPALEFDKWLSSTLWYEAFSMGYYAYYYMMMAVLLFYLIARYHDFQRATFVFLTSFFIYYLIFEFLPVAGPQYYFCAVGVEKAQLDVFPEVGNYFRDHTDMLQLEPRGIFSRLVLAAQEAGEHPTAAFPSSHVGMSTVTMLLAWRSRNRLLFWIMVPFYLLLVCATVYIKAHYAIDSIAGFVTAVLFFHLTSGLYPLARDVFRLKK